MALIKIIGKKGSQAVRDIVSNTHITRYKGFVKGIDAIINYGLAGKTMDNFLHTHPSAKKIPMLNPHIGRAKLSVINMAAKAGIVVPESRLTLPTSANTKEWIEKRQNSIGGKGIQYASKNRSSIDGKYFQKYINNRSYELRVHAFKWMHDWVIQKRIGLPGEIAWNYKNGGHFSTVHNTSLRVMVDSLEISKQILELTNMSFGAIDFLVDADRNIYFIEINSSPGFQELSSVIYINAFGTLQELTSKQLNKYAITY